MFYWDPNPDFFIIPFLNQPIKWYGVLFALGFSFGIIVWTALAKRFFLNIPYYIENDILAPTNLQDLGKNSCLITSSLNQKIKNFDDALSLEKEKKYVKKHAFFSAKEALARLSLDRIYQTGVLGVVKKVSLLADRFVIYIALGTIIGARLFHVLFYENPKYYLKDPFVIFRVWEGGLASHGGFVGIFLATLFFSKKIQKMAPQISFLGLLDLLSIPACLVGFFIRLGNFVNQEVLGIPSNLPWAVTFARPMDFSAIVPRHPVQIYEALFYLSCFLIFLKLAKNPNRLMSQGFFSGLFLIGIFGFRFFIEFLKQEQSFLIQANQCLTMGQMLSIPLIFMGCLFLLKSCKKNYFC